MLDRLRRRLTLGYVGIFALILVFLGTIAVLGFSRELTVQQDELLTQEAHDQTRNLLDGERREVLASGSDEFGWIALRPDLRIIDKDRAATSLGLPSAELARQALQEDAAVSATVRGSRGKVRVVSMPMRESGEVVGVIQYARSLEGVRGTVQGLVLVLLPLGLGGLGLAAIGGLYMASRAVRPIRESYERQRNFIADASHDLKTPLTLIQADAEVVLHRSSVDEEDRKLIEHALAETKRMSEMLSDLLFMARLDADKVLVERKVFDLAAVISGAVGRFETLADTEGILVDIRMPDELPARGDPTQTERILAVLLDNALRYTLTGGRIIVAAHGRDSWAEVSVIDTGPGIAPENLSRIFDRFYRVDTSRTRGGGGIGLGLSIARDLAQAQDGDLTAENVEGWGAAFRLRLPWGERCGADGPVGDLDSEIKEV
jgi:signal transduction histidine kinase